MFACYLIPLLYSLVTYLVIWISGVGGFYNKTFVSQVAHEFGWESLPAGLLIVIFFVVNGVIRLFSSMSTALGEEIGWRGFLVPELSKRGLYRGFTYERSYMGGLALSITRFRAL